MAKILAKFIASLKCKIVEIFTCLVKNYYCVEKKCFSNYSHRNYIFVKEDHDIYLIIVIPVKPFIAGLVYDGLKSCKIFALKERNLTKCFDFSLFRETGNIKFIRLLIVFL